MKIDKMKALIIICVTILMISAIGVFGALKIDSNRAERSSEVLSNNESEKIENKSSKLKQEDSKESNKEDSKKSNKENSKKSNKEEKEEGITTEQDVDARLAKIDKLIDEGKDDKAKQELVDLNEEYGFLTGHHEVTEHELFVRLGLVDEDQYPEDMEETESVDLPHHEEGSTSAMLSEANVAYETNDAKLNLVWTELKQNLPAEEFEVLLSEQLEWLEYRDAEAERAAMEFEGGSNEDLVRADTLADLTAERTRYLENY